MVRLSFSNSETSIRSNKKRTPPSAEKKISKRLNFGKHPVKIMMSENIKERNKEKEKDEEIDMETDHRDSDSDEEELGSFSAEQLAFKRRLIKFMSKIMKKELKSVKADLKKLNSRQKKQEKHIEEFETIREENKILKTACDKALWENKNLKERINKIENTLLDNNVILHGLREDPWE